jgi:hypothetical protein
LFFNRRLVRNSQMTSKYPILDLHVPEDVQANWQTMAAHVAERRVYWNHLYPGQKGKRIFRQVAKLRT